MEQSLSRNMNIFGHVAGFSTRPRFSKRILGSLLWLALPFATGLQNLGGYQDAQVPGAPLRTQQTPEQLQQLVAPVALYTPLARR